MTLVELGLKIGGLFRIPIGIVEPGFINREGGFGCAAGACVGGCAVSWPAMEIRPRARS